MKDEQKTVPYRNRISNQDFATATFTGVLGIFGILSTLSVRICHLQTLKSAETLFLQPVCIFLGLFWSILGIFMNLRLPELPNMPFYRANKVQKGQNLNPKTMILIFFGKNYRWSYVLKSFKGLINITTEPENDRNTDFISSDLTKNDFRFFSRSPSDHPTHDYSRRQPRSFQPVLSFY